MSVQIRHSARATRASVPAIVAGMDPSPRHRLAETRFRELVTGAGLEQPDGVDYEPDALIFRWSGPKVAVVVDLEPGPNGNGAG